MTIEQKFFGPVGAQGMSMSGSEQSLYVSLTEAAAILGVTKQTVARRVRSAGIPTFQGGDLREILIRRADLRRWQGIRPVVNTDRDLELYEVVR